MVTMIQAENLLRELVNEYSDSAKIRNEAPD